MDYKIKDDLKLVRSLFDLSQSDLAKDMNVERLRIARVEAGDNIPREDFLESFYNYCFSKGLKLNLQKEMFYKDDIEDGHILLTHASKNEIVGQISLDFGRINNDFGRGFYCGDAYEKAASFVCKSSNSCVYFIDFNPLGLKKVVFTVDQDWMIAIAYFRGRLDNYKEHKLVTNVINKIKEADYIIAPIADNRMFEIIDEFIEGLITDEQCKHSLAATNLGMQYVFLNDNSLNHLEVIERCYICKGEKDYYVKEQTNFQKQGIDKTKIARINYKNKGKYIEEIFK